MTLCACSLSPTSNHVCTTRQPWNRPFLMTSEGLGSCNTRCLQEIVGFLVLMSMHFQSCHDERTSVITKGLWKWDGKVSAFVLQISLNNLRHSWLGSIPGFRKSSSKGCPSAFASTCLIPWERQLLLKLTKASFDLPPCLHPRSMSLCVTTWEISADQLRTHTP